MVRSQLVVMQHLLKVYCEADELMHCNHCITTDELSSILPIGKGSVRVITEELIYAKVSACYVPQMLKDVHKETRKATATNFLHLQDSGGEGFQLHIGMGDETWVHHFEPKSKQQLMDLHHITPPRKKTFKSALTAGKPRLQSLGIRMMSRKQRYKCSEIFFKVINKIE